MNVVMKPVMGNLLPTQTKEKQHHCCSEQRAQFIEKCLCEEKQPHQITILPSLDSGYAKYDRLLKCSFIGPPKTGKTLLSSTLGKGDIDRRRYNYMPTSDINFCTLTVQHLNEKIKLQCWDLMGDKSFKVRSRSYLRGSGFILLFCDLNLPHEVIDWLHDTNMDQTLDKDDKIFLICDTPLSTNNGNIKQLQADIMTKYPSINIIDSFVFDYCKQQEFIDVLDTMFKNIHVKVSNVNTNSIKLDNNLCKKPAIYIYDNDQNTNVDIQLFGSMTIEIPTRNSNSSWNCQVVNNGLLIDNVVYPYIYWEAKWPHDTLEHAAFDNSKQVQQFVMKGSNYANFSKLLSTVLSNTELKDFDDYWQPVIKQDKCYRVSVVKPEYFDTVFPLTITVSDNKHYKILRLEFIFEQLVNDCDDQLPQQLNIIRPQISSDGDSEILIIEWGGSCI